MRLDLGMRPKDSQSLCCYLLHSDLPPSQGGKYGGFGNTVERPKKEESEFFSDAWSTFSSVCVMM